MKLVAKSQTKICHFHRRKALFEAVLCLRWTDFWAGGPELEGFSAWPCRIEVKGIASGGGSSATLTPDGTGFRGMFICSES